MVYKYLIWYISIFLHSLRKVMEFVKDYIARLVCLKFLSKFIYSFQMAEKGRPVELNTGV